METEPYGHASVFAQDAARVAIITTIQHWGRKNPELFWFGLKGTVLRQQIPQGPNRYHDITSQQLEPNTNKAAGTRTTGYRNKHQEMRLLTSGGHRRKAVLCQTTGRGFLAEPTLLKTPQRE